MKKQKDKVILFVDNGTSHPYAVPKCNTDFDDFEAEDIIRLIQLFSTIQDRFVNLKQIAINC